jgi:hypothetical protein
VGQGYPAWVNGKNDGKTTMFHGKISIFNGKINYFYGKSAFSTGKSTIFLWENPPCSMETSTISTGLFSIAKR